MGIFADPRAMGLTALEDGQMRLMDQEVRIIATAICYGAWWGVCSHRSGIPIDRRATNDDEARGVLMTTLWMYPVSGDRSEGLDTYSLSAREGILYIRSLLDQELLEAARDDTGPAFRMISEWMGESTNPTWITHQCAETAYMRDVMDAQEMDWICR